MDAIQSYGGEEDKSDSYGQAYGSRQQGNVNRAEYRKDARKRPSNNKYSREPSIPGVDNANGSPSNMEWDSTYDDNEEQYGDGRGNTRPDHSNRDRRKDGLINYNDNEYDRRGGKGYEYNDRKRERDNDRGRRENPREREIDRELERARYGDRNDGGTRDRDRSWDRDRGRPWGRDQGRFGDRDKDASWDRNRDHSRDRGREKDRDQRERGRDRGRERDRDRRRDDRNDRDRDGDDRYSRDRRLSSDRERFAEKERIPPSAHIIVRGSAAFFTKEDDLAVQLQKHDLEYQDIKIVRNRHGESRGFGFVDFYDVETAEKWMNITKGTIMVADKRCTLDFSKAKVPTPNQQADIDWYCSKCHTLNYASRKRMTCFSCGEQRKDHPVDSQDNPDVDEPHSSVKESPISAPPCNVLMMRGLDTNTAEETIRNHLADLTSLPIYDVRLIKDKVTTLSRGFCFIEFGSTEDATSLLEKIRDSDPAYFIEGRRISVGYAKNTPNPPPSKSQQGVDNRAGGSQNVSKSSKIVNLASVAIAQAQAAQIQQYDQVVSNPQQATDTTRSSASISVTNVQATTTSQQNASLVKGSQLQQQVHNQPQQQQQNQPYANYVYDPTTGYYYDPNTGLYYDANTGYYYNGQTGRFLHWDKQQQQYFIVNQDGTLSGMDSEGNPVSASSTPAEKVKAKPTGSSAKKIAKDMERWAKKTNEAKLVKSNAVKQAQMLLKEQEAREEAMRQQIQIEILQSAALSALPKQDVISITSKSLFAADDDSLSLAALIAARTEQKGIGLVAEYGNDSDDEDKLIDWDQLTCLLCKRQFPNKDVLTKHQQMSDLHKQNLEKYKQKSKR